MIRLDTTVFGLDRPEAGLALSIDVGHQTGENDEPSTELPESVNYAIFLVPYPFLGKTGPVALEMAFQLAEKLDWSVYDLQADCELSRESLPAALAMQETFGQTAQEVLARAVGADPSVGELFGQEMWNHSIFSAAACVIFAAVGIAWLLLELDRPKADFDRYMPWAVSIGGLGLILLKGLAQAIARHRRRRPKGTPLNARDEGAA